MWLPTDIVTAPTLEPVTAAEAKEFLRIDPTDTWFDAQIAIFIKSARAALEWQTGSRLLTQTVRMRCSAWSDLDRLATAPVQTITSIKYLDASGAEQTLDPANYVLFGAKLVFGIRPAPAVTLPTVLAAEDAIRVQAVVGYGDTVAALPETLRLAMLKLIRAALNDEIVDISGDIVNDRIWL